MSKNRYVLLGDQKMNRFEIRLSRDAQKSMIKIHQSLPAIGRKIVRVIDELQTSPLIGMKLAGADGEVRRIRVGEYRVVYEVFRKEILILIVYIGPRGGAYRQ